MIRYILVLFLLISCSGIVHAQDFRMYKDSFPSKHKNLWGNPGLQIDSVTKLITYTAIMHTDTALSANELYKRARNWFAMSFNDGISAIQYEDKEDGRFVARGAIFVHAVSRFSLLEGAGFIRFTLVMQFKKGKYRYTFTRFFHDAGASKIESGGALENKDTHLSATSFSYDEWQTVKKQVDEQMQALITSLNVYMAFPVANNDW